MPDIDNTLNRHPTTIYNGSATAQQPKVQLVQFLIHFLCGKSEKEEGRTPPSLYTFTVLARVNTPLFRFLFGYKISTSSDSLFIFPSTVNLTKKINKNVVAVEKIYSLLVEIKRSKYAHIIIRLIGESQPPLPLRPPNTQRPSVQETFGPQPKTNLQKTEICIFLLGIVIKTDPNYKQQKTKFFYFLHLKLKSQQQRFFKSTMNSDFRDSEHLMMSDFMN